MFVKIRGEGEISISTNISIADPKTSTPLPPTFNKKMKLKNNKVGKIRRKKKEKVVKSKKNKYTAIWRKSQIWRNQIWYLLKVDLPNIQLLLI